MRLFDHSRVSVLDSRIRNGSGLPGLAAAALLLLAPTVSSAEADGPDYFRVQGISAGSALSLRAGPSTDGERIGRIPADVDGLRNLGCIGGMDAEAWSQATAEEREAAARTRWCRIDYRGTQGWVAGWFLAEGTAAQNGMVPDKADPPSVREVEIEIPTEEKRTIAESISGRDSIIYGIEAIAGERLAVSLVPAESLSVSLITPGSDEALPVAGGNETAAAWSLTLRDTGSYGLRVSLLPDAAATDDAVEFEMSLGLAAAEQPVLAGYVPPAETDFDATTLARCWMLERGFSSDCAVGLYHGVSTRTVYLRRPHRSSDPPRILVFRDSEVSSVPAAKVEAEHAGDDWMVVIDEREHYVIPDALLTGG